MSEYVVHGPEHGTYGVYATEERATSIASDITAGKGVEFSVKEVRE